MTTIANMDLETATLDQLENLTISDLLGQNLADVELRSTLPDGTYIFAFDKSAVKAFAADPEKNKKASINLNLFLKVVRCIQCADPEMDPASLTNRVHIQQFPMHMAHGPANAAMLILGVLGVPFKDKAAMAEAGGTMGELLETMINEKGNIRATGYAVINVQAHDNPAQQRLLAIRASKLDAYRSLMEQVYGQYLDVNTTVGQMIVESDTFRARVQGVIYGAYLVSITPVGDDTYEVTLSLDRDIVRDLRVLYLQQMTASAGQ